jgi:hypothetical protein
MSDFSEFDTLEYSFADGDSARREGKQIPEQTLWSAVINQAFADMLNGNRVARDWLLCEREDFVLVCSLAGVSPFAVRIAARRMSKAHKL